MPLKEWLVLFLMVNFASANFISDGLEQVDEEKRQDWMTVLEDSGAFDISRAGCKDQLPSKMTSNSSCRKLKKTCAKLKSSCSKKLQNSLGSSSNANKCKNALGNTNGQKRVREFCKITCKQCANGGYSAWGAYTACTKTCGGGTKSRSRSCTNPKPFGGGSGCSGSNKQTVACNSATCPEVVVPTDGSWMPWSEWSPCSVTCAVNGTTANGTRTRDRTCTPPTNGGLNCTGNSTETEACNTTVACLTCFDDYMKGGIEMVLAKIEEMVQKIAELEEIHANNTALITMNERRHQNTDQSFKEMCYLIDNIFDDSSHPGDTQYDCCQETFTGTTGQIGGAFMCIPQSTLEQLTPAPFAVTKRGKCDTTCGTLPNEFAAGYQLPEKI